MTVVACAVGLLGPEGRWIGFAPTLEDEYALVIGEGDGSSARATATSDELVALAIAYFADELPEPPEALAATHGDIAALIRHLAMEAGEMEHARFLAEAVDAIDDGLAADVVVGRLSRCLSGDEEPEARLVRRAAELLGRA